MINWGRKKPSSSSSSSSSSSHPHLISHVFPLSWFSRFKRKSEKTNVKTCKSSQKESAPLNLQRVSSVKSSKNPIPAYYWDSKLYTQDNDGFWTLSANKENKGGINDELVVPSNYCGKCKSNVREAAVKKRSPKAKVLNSESSPFEKGMSGSKEVARNDSLQRTYRRIMEATEELHKELDEVNEYRKSVEKELSEFELEQVMQLMGRADERLPYLHSGKNAEVISRNRGEFQQEIWDGNDDRSEWQKLKDAKIKEVLQKNEKHRKSFHVGRGINKIRVSSPKTPLKMEPCKIQALENMKKAKMKKKMQEMQLEDKASNLGSFAVVKSSQDPQQDFRDSMLEMIMEKRITRPEELEELLACYLTLNADEYHDIIIKVFRQVWQELEEAANINQKKLQKF